jgi:NAD(P)-dependent dehydrogenase (short-subunit alcohol dehydrogenase family)
VDFRNRHIVVTGGTGGLGSAVVGALLGAGASCHVSYRVDAETKDFPHRAHSRVQLVATGSLAEEAAVARLFDAAPNLWASIHLAGGFAFGPVATDKAALMQQIETNLVTCFLCCRAAVRAMARGKAGGRIVNVASRPGLEWRAGAGVAAYTASKAAVAALTTALAEEVVKDGILVNAVAPSIMDTPANRQVCRRRITPPGPRLKKWQERFYFSPRPTIKSRAAPSPRSTDERNQCRVRRSASVFPLGATPVRSVF